MFLKAKLNKKIKKQTNHLLLYMYVCITYSKHIKEIHKQIVLKAFESSYKIRRSILTNI